MSSCHTAAWSHFFLSLRSFTVRDWVSALKAKNPHCFNSNTIGLFYSSSLFIHNVTALIETIREKCSTDIAKTNLLQLWGDRETEDNGKAHQQHRCQRDTASRGCQEEPPSKYETRSNKSDCYHWLRQVRYLWRGQKVSRGRRLALREAWNPSFGTPALVGSVSLGESKSFHQKWSRERCCPAHCVHTMQLRRTDKEAFI